MRRSHAESEYQPVQINVIPLIDVMFFLVLFFVATSSFERDTGVPVERPAAQSGKALERDTIVVTVQRTGEVWVAGKRTDPRLLRPEVERLLAGNPNSTVVVAADATGSARLLVDALDQVRLAGATSVAIATTSRDRAE